MADRHLLPSRSSSSLLKENKSFKRKLEKKQKFYAKVKDAVVSLSAKKQSARQREGAQLRQVLNDPSFQLDPLAAIHQHLQRTQPPPACDKEKISGKAKRNKKRTKKPSSGSQSMDI